MQIFNETTPRTAIPLARYAQLINYNECAFFGVSSENNANFACRKLWSQDQRELVRYYLAEAQDELEQIIQYPLQPTWFADEEHSFNSNRGLITKYGKIIALGVKTEQVISDGAVVDLVTDPDICTVTISPVTVSYPLTEIHIFYPDTDVEIIPSDITWDSTTSTLVISIPRCRMVKYSDLENSEEGWLYSDNSHFQGTVDVHRIYNNTAIQGKIFYKGDVCSSFCSEAYESVCGFIKNAEIGSVELDYPSCLCSSQYTKMSISYVAGLSTLTRQAEMTLIRLAHSKMPDSPCGCDFAESLWRRDRHVPEILTKERINCPFGMSDGAWMAWKWACGMELVRAGALI